MNCNIKKILCIILTVISLFSVCVCHAVTVSAAKTNKYSDFIKYRGQDLKNTYAKLSKGDEVNVLYYGGSVTNGTGASDAEKYSWRALVSSWLTKSFPKAKVNNINVSYGGTGSYFGAYRINEDVISKKPDLIFIEFSINDHYDNQVRALSYEQSSKQFETIVRTIRSALPMCDIVTVLTTERGYININRGGKLHTHAQAHEDISNAYNIPSLHVGRALACKLKSGNTIDDWNKYMWNNNDIVHPNDKGYAVYFEVFKEYLSNCLKNGGYDGKAKNHKLPRLVNDYLLDGNTTYIDVTEELVNKSRDLGGKNFQFSTAKKLRGSFEGGADATNGTNSKFVLEFTGTELAILQSSTEVECFQVVVDGETTFATNYKIYPEVLVTGLKSGKHTVVVQPVFKEGVSRGAFFIMGFFSRDESKASAKYDHPKHIFKKYVSNEDATCRKDGTKTAKCSVSGCDMTDTITDEGTKLTHKYKIKVIKKATDTKDGEGEKICTVCGRFEGTVVIPKGKSADDIINSQNSDTQSATDKDENKDDGLTIGADGTSSSTITNDNASSQLADNSLADKKNDNTTTLIIILAVVLSLLVAGIVVLVVIIIKRKKAGLL